MVVRMARKRTNQNKKTMRNSLPGVNRLQNPKVQGLKKMATLDLQQPVTQLDRVAHQLKGIHVFLFKHEEIGQ